MFKKYSFSWVLTTLGMNTAYVKNGVGVERRIRSRRIRSRRMRRRRRMKGCSRSKASIMTSSTYREHTRGNAREKKETQREINGSGFRILTPKSSM